MVNRHVSPFPGCSNSIGTHPHVWAFNHSDGQDYGRIWKEADVLRQLSGRMNSLRSGDFAGVSALFYCRVLNPCKPARRYHGETDDRSC
jgi:hypothetical protein